MAEAEIRQLVLTKIKEKVGRSEIKEDDYSLGSVTE
jgi:hypothetical protein